MKRGASILLLSCFLFYHFGYYIYFVSLKHQIEYQWKEKVFEDSFPEEMMMELPISIPYMANQEDFQITNTSFSKDGRKFRAVKQRYANDTLQIIYVPDVALVNLKSTVKKWIVILNTEQQPNQSKGKLTFLNATKDFTRSLFEFITLPSIVIIPPAYGNNDFFQKGIYLLVDSPPPEIMLLNS